MSKCLSCSPFGPQPNCLNCNPIKPLTGQKIINHWMFEARVMVMPNETWVVDQSQAEMLARYIDWAIKQDK